MAETVLELEGTWEDILSRARDLEGKHIRLTATSGVISGNAALRKAMAHAREIQAGMGRTRAGDTVGMIRKGRAGAMYGTGSDG